MRSRLLSAVRTLLADPSLAGVPDAARLAAVVLFAKSRAPQGRPNDSQTSTWGAELGRWLGVTESSVHHGVLPVLRESGAVRTRVVTDAKGHPTGLDCLVMPLWKARRAGVAGHALALTRVELAVLLRLCEVLFGPGWMPKGKAPIPPGMLASRTGRGAATDRLGLLLMTLSTNSRGWLQLCPGSIDVSRGRPAATVARLLGCSPAGGAKVLKRLEDLGVADVARCQTGSGMNGKSRIRLLAVAEAHGHTVREPPEVAKAVLADLPATASGDLEGPGQAGTTLVSGLSSTGKGEYTSAADLAVAAEPHTTHASVATSGRSLSLSRFSGEDRDTNAGRPERAHVRVDGPLRGEQQEKSPSISSNKAGRGPVADAPVRVMVGDGQGKQQRGRVPLPPEDLRAVLAPVDLVWARLERPAARRLVEAAVRSELGTVGGFVGRVDAPEVLADRLARRLADQMRLAGPIKDPVGWLIGLGLPQRQQCGDVRCDDRVLLDSGQDCPRCSERWEDRRDQRRVVAAAVDAAMPGASEAKRRAATTAQLHQDVTARAWAQVHKWDQVRARQAAAAQNRTEAAAAQPQDQVPAAPMARVALPAPRPVAVAPVPEVADVDDDQELVLEDLTREKVLDWRNRAAADHRIVHDHIARYGEHSAQRLFTRSFVATVQRLSSLAHLDLGYTPWRHA